MFVIQDSLKPEGKNFFRRLPGGAWQFTNLQEATTFKTEKKARQTIERYLEEYYEKETDRVLSEDEYNQLHEAVMAPFWKPLRDLEGDATGDELQEIQCSDEWLDLYDEISPKAYKASEEKYHWRTCTTAKVMEVKTTLVES